MLGQNFPVKIDRHVAWHPLKQKDVRFGFAVRGKRYFERAKESASSWIRAALHHPSQERNDEKDETTPMSGHVSVLDAQ